MSIRNGLLALLEGGAMYGYQLRAEFERRTGGTWPLNIGQVYTTLGRLERDGLVVPAGATAESAPTTDDTTSHPLTATATHSAAERGDGPHRRYALTPTGRAEVAGWFATPVPRDAPPRDELAIKLALALTVPGVDVREVVRLQRTATVRTLQDYTRLKRQADESGDLAWLLVLDSLVFQAEAEIRWLDHCESRLARHADRLGAQTRGLDRAAASGHAAAVPDRTAAVGGPAHVGQEAAR